MLALSKPLEEQLELAVNCNDYKLLWELHKSPYMNVRRAVARNKYINSKIADDLLNDPVLNVSYMARLSNKTTINKKFDTNFTKCVLCEVSELDLNCMDCTDK